MSWAFCSGMMTVLIEVPNNDRPAPCINKPLKDTSCRFSRKSESVSTTASHTLRVCDGGGAGEAPSPGGAP